MYLGLQKVVGENHVDSSKSNPTPTANTTPCCASEFSYASLDAQYSALFCSVKFHTARLTGSWDVLTIKGAGVGRSRALFWLLFVTPSTPLYYERQYDTTQGIMSLAISSDRELSVYDARCTFWR
jgi:hypothetical protein